jgi:hypothetical protein
MLVPLRRSTPTQVRPSAELRAPERRSTIPSPAEVANALYQHLGAVFNSTNVNASTYEELLRGVDPQIRAGFMLEIQDRSGNNAALVTAKSDALVKLLESIGAQARQAPADALAHHRAQREVDRLLNSAPHEDALAAIAAETSLAKAQSVAAVQAVTMQTDAQIDRWNDDIRFMERQLVFNQQKAQALAMGSLGQRQAELTAKKLELEIRKQTLELSKVDRKVRREERKDARRERLSDIADAVTPRKPQR